MRLASKSLERSIKTQTHHLRWFLTGFAVSAVWMAVGCLLTFSQGDDLRWFIRTWINYQGPFLIWLGTWLLLMIRSGSFKGRVSQLAFDRSVKLEVVSNRFFRFTVAALVTALTFVSGVRMGFDGRGAVLVFELFTFFCIEVATGLVTLHALEVLVVVHNLQYQNINLSHYAPARTPKLGSVVRYFTTYILLMAIGQALGLWGSIAGHWTGPQRNVDIFRWFWSLFYFPTCSLMLVYTHWIVHRLIRNDKELTLSRYKDELDELLSRRKSRPKR